MSQESSNIRLEPPSRPPRSSSDLQSNAEHIPSLADPSKQIRLAFLFSSAEDEAIELQLEPWNRDATPDYIAISYTWGEDTDHKTLYINGIPIKVRPNCHYALWQVRLHHPNSYVWIDTLCIDQANLSEKSFQVAMMGDIYKSAIRTCACVAPISTHDSLLAQFILDVGRLQIPFNNKGDEDAGSDFWNRWCDSHVAVDVEALRSAVRDFEARPYWKRIWIIQELLLSEDIDVLFGAHRADWEDVCHLRQTKDLHTPQLVVLERLTVWHKVQVTYMAATLAEFECFDDRDRIYGLLSCLEWPGDGKLTVIPDYTQTLLQLAIGLSRGLGQRSMYQVIKALRLSRSDSGLAELVARRQETLAQSPPLPSGEEYQAKYSQEASVGQVRVDSNGRLQCSLALLPRWKETWPTRELPEEAEETRCRSFILEILHGIQTNCTTSQTKYTNQQPRPLFIGDEIAAVVCSSTQAGDEIASSKLSEFADDETLLVLRPAKDGAFDIIGQGFLLPGYKFCDGSRTACMCVKAGIGHHSYSTSSLQLNISDEDAVVLAAQDLKPGASLGFDLDARFERLITRVSGRLYVTAR